MTNVFIFKTAALVATLIGCANANLETVKLTNLYGSSTEIFLFGAHVKSFHAAMDKDLDLLFMSKCSKMDGKHPVRGGIPIVYPNFGGALKQLGAEKLPGHGFARVSNWTLVHKANSTDKKKPSVAIFKLVSSDATRKMWPFDFELKYVVKLHANALETALHVRNTDTKPIKFHALLHNYLAVDDVRKAGVSVSGLDGVVYFDKVAKVTKKEDRKSIKIMGEIDNVYKKAPDRVTATITGVNAVDRSVVVEKSGSICSEDGKDKTTVKTDVVLWNPWDERAKTMPDFGAEEYNKMVAIEPGYVDEQFTLSAGKTFKLHQSISVYTL
ncbi:unnamed protein product [Peronospora belbahrii]|uniref:glucose-6-phosphate 1-epimerase n=1 Tax=Peronospora belbahrii TaxID=622444 RepID=A0ABN8D7Y9_9STRA|nr:unnamed protein product [Peronospora belbahrii]